MTRIKQTFSISETAQTLVPDKLGRMSYVWTLVIILLLGAVITALFGKMPPVVPLYYSLPWGEARLVPKVFLYAIPLIVLVFAVINIVISRIAAKISSLLPRVLAVACMVVAGMMLVAVAGIIQSLIL